MDSKREQNARTNKRIGAPSHGPKRSATEQSNARAMILSESFGERTKRADSVEAPVKMNRARAG